MGSHNPAMFQTTNQSLIKGLTQQSGAGVNCMGLPFRLSRRGLLVGIPVAGQKVSKPNGGMTTRGI